MIYGLVFIILVLVVMMHPLLDSYQWCKYFKDNFAVPLVILISSIVFANMPQSGGFLLPLILAFYSYYTSHDRSEMYQWYTVIAIYLVLYLLKVPIEYHCLFGGLYYLNKKFVSRPWHLFSIAVMGTLFIFGIDTIHRIWADYSTLLLIPIAIMLAFENAKNRISQVVLVSLFVLLTQTGSEFFEDFFLIIGLFLAVISSFRNTELSSKSLSVAAGVYLAFYVKQSVLLVPIISYIVLETIYYKKLFISEVQKVLLDSNHFSIGYTQVAAFFTLLLVFSGLPFTPFSILYSLSSMSVVVVLILLFLDFPFLTFEALGSRGKSTTIQEDIIKLLIFVLPLLPIASGKKIVGFYFQLVPFLLTGFLFFYFRKNKWLEYRLKEIFQKLKFSYESLPDRSFNGAIAKPEKKNYPGFEGTLFTYNGISFTLVFGIYLFFLLAVIYWISK
jgi:hypothetical protein